MDEPLPPRPEPLAPLPIPITVQTDRFSDMATCAQCHTASDTALRDASGRDVSPIGLGRTSMMALAARDPFYLAVFAEELARAPENRETIERTCSRCHAPAAHEELDGALTFELLTTSTDPIASLGREGVTCSLCHQISDSDLGTERSFTGGFTVDYGRKIFGPHANPFVDPMRMFVNFTPTLGAHIGQSELCATCHTVIVDDVVEQATYLEWRSSSLATTTTCQTCHVPTHDADGTQIVTPISRFPTNLSVRSPIGRHRFMGGNANMLRVIAAGEAWANTQVPAEDLEAAARDAEAHLASAAELRVTAQDTGGTTELVIDVVNHTGHKLPTGYPSRRMWLHVTVRDGGRILYESGAPDATGALPSDGTLAPHRRRVDTQEQVQIWEAVLVDRDGTPTHRALDAAGYGKDNRILPQGFAPSVANRPRTEPVGTETDVDFVPGSDRVVYVLGDVPSGATATVELLFQSLTPRIVDAVDASRTPAATRFADLVRATPPRPTTMATTSLDLP